MESRTATVVLAQKIDPARAEEYERWQEGINRAASEFPGYVGAEVVRPTPGVQDDWVIVYRFDTHEHLSGWLDSEEREQWIERAAELCFEPPVAQNVAVRALDQTVTVVASQRVKPGREGAYRRWQKGINDAASRFPGFVSAELFEPVPGEQEEWVVVFRFDQAARLDAWLSSDERAQWLERAEPFLERIALHKVGGGLGGWFPVSERAGTAAVTPAWKQAMAVLLALYPTVIVLLALLESPLSAMPAALGTFVSNVVSVGILTWCMMPIVTRALAAWLDPTADRRTTILGVLVLNTLYALMVAGFWIARV